MKIKVIILLSSLLLGGILCETALRIASVIAVNRRNNSYADIDRKAFTIVCVGDSVTYGWGDQTNEGYPKKLEVILNRESGRRTVVINKGLPGSSTAGVLRQLKEALDTVPHVDLVIILTGNGNSLWNFKEMYDEMVKYPLCLKDRVYLNLDKFFSNSRLYLLVKSCLLKTRDKNADSKCWVCLYSAKDLWDISQSPDTCEEPNFGKIVSAYGRCLSASKHCNQACFGIFGMYSFCGKDINKEKRAVIQNYPETNKLFMNRDYLNLNSLVRKVMQENITEMVNMCIKKKIRVLLLLDYPGGKSETVFSAELFNKQGVELFGLYDYFRNELNCYQCKEYFYDSVHLNSRGYYLMAQRIAEIIRR